MSLVRRVLPHKMGTQSRAKVHFSFADPFHEEPSASIWADPQGQVLRQWRQAAEVGGKLVLKRCVCRKSPGHADNAGEKKTEGFDT